nr:hypothetical protein [Desulfopila inferna]
MEVVAFDVDVTGQIAKPAKNIAKHIVKQPDKATHDYEQYAYD